MAAVSEVLFPPPSPAMAPPPPACALPPPSHFPSLPLPRPIFPEPHSSRCRDRAKKRWRKEKPAKNGRKLQGAKENGKITAAASSSLPRVLDPHEMGKGF